MEEQEQKKETIKETIKKDDTSRMAGIKRLLSYGWVVKNIYYFLFLAVLAVVYIYNGHYAENTIKDINRSAKELRELQYEYKTLKGELMMRGKQSELAKAVEPLGLKELKEPPLKIEAKK
ncbi:MAG: FtsL-like putative cell division protein [Agriterribacter sp.]